MALVSTSPPPPLPPPLLPRLLERWRSAVPCRLSLLTVDRRPRPRAASPRNMVVPSTSSQSTAAAPPPQQSANARAEPIYHDGVPVSALEEVVVEPPQSKCWTCVRNCVSWRQILFSKKYWAIGFAILLVVVIARAVGRYQQASQRLETQRETIKWFLRNHYGHATPSSSPTTNKRSDDNDMTISSAMTAMNLSDDEFMAKLTRSRFRLIDGAAVAADGAEDDDDDDDEEKAEEEEEKVEKSRRRDRRSTVVVESPPARRLKLETVWLLALIQAFVGTMLYLASLLCCNDLATIETRVVTTNLMAACAIGLIAVKVAHYC